MLICKICKRGFIIERGISRLLCKDNYLVCNRCYKDNPINLNISNIPLNNGRCLKIITLFDNDSYLNYSSFIYEYSKVASFYIKFEPIFLDRIYLNEKFISDMNDLSEIKDDDIYVLTYKCEI